MFPWIKKLTSPEARTFIACTISIMVVFGLAYYITHAEDKNAYTVCTVNVWNVGWKKDTGVCICDS